MGMDESSMPQQAGFCSIKKKRKRLVFRVGESMSDVFPVSNCCKLRQRLLIRSYPLGDDAILNAITNFYE